jgi:hypothetical protein
VASNTWGRAHIYNGWEGTAAIPLKITFKNNKNKRSNYIIKERNNYIL